MSIDKSNIDLLSQKAKKRSIEDTQPCPSTSDGKGSEMKKKKKKKKKKRNIDDTKPIQNTSDCNGSEMKKKKKKKKRRNIDNTENTSDCNGSQIMKKRNIESEPCPNTSDGNGSQIKKKRNIDDTKPIQNTSDCNGSEMKKKEKKRKRQNIDNTENISDCSGSQIKKKRNIDDTNPIQNTSDCNGAEMKKKKKKRNRQNIDNTENTSDFNGSQIKRNIDDTKPISNTSDCSGSEMKKKKKKKKKRNIDNTENTFDCNGPQIKKKRNIDNTEYTSDCNGSQIKRNIESEPCPNTSDGNSTEVKKKKKKKKKKRHEEKSASVHITPDDAETDLNINSEQTRSRTERETCGLISNVNSAVKRDLKRKRKKVQSGNEFEEEVVKKKRNVDKELSANMSDDSALRKAKKKKKKKKHKEKISVTPNDSVVDPGLVIKVEENINVRETSASVCSTPNGSVVDPGFVIKVEENINLGETNVDLLSEKASGTPDRISPSYIGYSDCMSGVSKRKKRKSSSMNGESMNKVTQHLVDKFEFCPTSSDEGSMEAPAEQKKHSKKSHTDTSVSKKKKKRKKQIEENQTCSPSGEKGSQDHRGSRKQSQEGSVSDKAKSNDGKETSISGFKYSLVAVEKDDDSNTDANGKKKRVRKKKTMIEVEEEEKEPKFESWNENCILLPEEISQLVHQNKCRLTQADRQHNHKMGIRFREGYFTEREDEILKKNFEEYLKFNPVDEPWKLLFATQTTEPVKYKRICKETNFYIQLAGRLNRPTNACYFRARTLLFPGKTNGRFTEEEDQLLSELQSKQSGHWMRSGMEMGRTAQALFNRWKKIQKNNIRKEKDYNAGKWNEEENERLMQALKVEVGQEENVFSKELLTKIRWIEIAKKVQTRDLMSCYRHWAHLVATQTDEGQATKCRWAKDDSDRLIQMVYELDIEFKDEIDWRSLLPHFPSSQTVETLKRKWADLCRAAPRFTEMSFNELREWLYEFKRKNKNKKGS